MYTCIYFIQFSNNGTPVKTSKLSRYAKSSFPGADNCHSEPPSLANSATFNSFEYLNQDTYNQCSTPPYTDTPSKTYGTPIHTLNDMQYNKRYQAHTYDPLLNR